MNRKRGQSQDRARQIQEGRAHAEILALVDRVGIRPEFRRIPEAAKSRLYQRPCLPPTVTLDDSLRDDPQARAAAERIRARVRESVLILDAFGDAKLPLTSAFSALPHLEHFLTRLAAGSPEMPAAVRCREVIAEVTRQVMPVAGSALEAAVLSQLMTCQRFDVKVFGVRFPPVAEIRERPRLELRIFREPARRHDIVFEGVSRPAYQCGGFIRPGVIDWVEWKPGDVGLDGPDEAFPVCVQSHAINQFYERVEVPSDHNEPMVMIFQSLLRPNVVVRNADHSLLVECPSEVGRLGYFVVRFVGDRFLVSTFLFLTMKGTPEAAKLYERLRAGRHAVELTRLDRLSTFIVSDIRNDPEIAAVLGECGCAHLLRIADRAPFEVPALMEHAENLRRILGWGPPRARVDAPDVRAAGGAA